MKTTWQTVRVFISSTFRDMQAERDHLVRFVFPRLREVLLKRRIHLVDVDLRWGVTSEQDALEVCREIIDECRPRFLCMLGGRYGTIPEGKDLSITADEVHFGALDEYHEKIYALFYFRHGAVTEKMDQSNPGSIREPRHSEKANKLAWLKRDIRKAKLQPYLYRPCWNAGEGRLLDLKAFGDRVERDILATIEDEFGTQPSVQLDEFAEETAAMEAFVAERSERFVLGSRETVLNELLAHASATGGNGSVCLTGAPGSGKSALLAHLSQHSTLNAQPSTLLIGHFVGASPGSTDVRRTLRRLCHELKAGCPDITADIPDDPEKLRVAFPDFLRQACEKKRVVILLDAVNQFDVASHPAGLHWLPEDLPASARVILSTLAGPALEDLRRRCQPREIELQSLAVADGEAIIAQFRKRYRKQFEPDQRAALLAKSDAGIPLYLLAALEELRTLGTYEEIGQRISELPHTTLELFAWILVRLENDDGFRDAAGRRVGSELVSRFAALLGASRYGLSQSELADLLDAGDPQGNIAALLYLLRPYLMHRGELLDFYHVQFRIAAKKAWLNTDVQCKAAHARLASYFRGKADPDSKQLWQQNARLLGELPFHLAHGAREMELLELFSQLAFLAARIATGQVYEQITDYSLLGSLLPSTLAPWHDFLQKHAQRLTQHPTMLVALANHEGFPEARAQAAKVSWCQPWLRTSPEQMPAGGAKSTEGLYVQITGNLHLDWGRVSAIASQRAIAFCLECLGTIRVLDLNAMRQTDEILSIRRDRPLVLSCAPDATSVVVFYESGKAELYRCLCGPNNWPTRVELVIEFSFYLPESEDPVVVWYKNTFWYQARSGALTSISVESPQAFEEVLPAGQQGELSALVFVEDTRLVAMRQGPDTLLLAPDIPPLQRRSAHVATACACGARKVAVAFTDGALVVFEIGETLTVKAEVRVGMLRGALGWDGSRLLWMGEGNSGFSAWYPVEASPLHVQDNQEVFPNHLHILPRQWLLRPDGSMLLGTTHSIVTFWVLQGGVKIDGRLEEIFGGPVWRAVRRAVRKQGNDQWLLEKQRPSEVLLGHGVMGRLYCALDGKERFFAASGYGPSWAFDLSSLRSMPLQGCPSGINGAVGEDRGGCWFTDRAGDIYFTDEGKNCHCAAKNELPDVHGSHLENCGSHLVWAGYSSKYFPETGTEPARTFLFFRKVWGNPPMLERIGEQLRHPREGFCVEVCYDQTAERLVTLWVKATDGVQTFHLRVGPVREFAHWQFQEIDVSGLGLSRFVQADLSADGRLLGVINMAGEISCISIEDGRVLATLAGSEPFTAVAPGQGGSEFWLVEAGASIYRCALVEGTV